MQWHAEVPGGDVPVIADDAGSSTIVILAHGAGSSMDGSTMSWLASIVRSSGARSVRFNFLYRALGKGMPDRMPVLIETYRTVIASVTAQFAPERLIIGGHSMGGRTASMLLAEETVADGLLLFGYPLHPAGRPEKLRDAHLAEIKVPTLQFNGTQDDLCTPSIMEQVVPRRPDWNLHWIEGADHSYAMKKASGRTRAEVAEELRSATLTWISEL